MNWKYNCKYSLTEATFLILLFQDSGFRTKRRRSWLNVTCIVLFTISFCFLLLVIYIFCHSMLFINILAISDYGKIQLIHLIYQCHVSFCSLGCPTVSRFDWCMFFRDDPRRLQRSQLRTFPTRLGCKCMYPFLRKTGSQRLCVSSGRLFLKDVQNSALSLWPFLCFKWLCMPHYESCGWAIDNYELSPNIYVYR